MADEFLDLFTQLFYSAEPWGYLGIAIVGILFLLAISRVKEFTPISFLIFSLWGVEYLQSSSAGGLYIWHSLICFVIAVLSVLIGLGGYMAGRD